MSETREQDTGISVDRPQWVSIVGNSFEAATDGEPLTLEMWNAVAEWERLNQRNNKHTMDELSVAYERAHRASAAIQQRLAITREAANLLDLADHENWAIAPQCNGGWVICETHDRDISGDAPEGRELARTRGTLIEALAIAATLATFGERR